MAITFLEPTRYPVGQLLALNEDLSTLMDLSAFLVSADLSFTDELVSQQGTFVLANPKAFFDKLSTGGGAAALTENRLLRYKKGFVDLSTGLPVYTAAFVGRITSGRPTYTRGQGETLTVVAFDMLKLSLKRKFTSDPYYNTQINLIAQDLDTRYGDKASTLLGTNLAALSYSLEYAQFCDMTLIDCYQDLFDIPVYSIWKNYAGQLASRPKLGAGGAALLGFPDAASPPATVNFTFPDAGLIESIEEEWQDHEFVNQVRVLGRSLAETVTLGPDQVLTTLGDPVNSNFIAPRAGITKRIYFAPQSGNSNQVSAQAVYLKIYDASFHLHDNTYYGGTNGGDYRYLASGPGLVNDLGNVIPYPIYDQSFPPGHQNVVSQKSSGKTEGGIAIAALTPTFVDVQVFANSDGGGFIWAIEVHGRPVLTDQQTLTAIVDYNPQPLTESLTDAFGDHQTYQGTKAPWAMGTPVEVAVGPSGMPSATLTAAVSAGASSLSVGSVAGFLAPSTPSITAANILAIGTGATREYSVVQGIAGSVLTLSGPLTYAHIAGEVAQGLTAVISADDVYRSLLVKGDWDRGRLVFTDLTYRPFTADPGIGAGTPGASVSGGNVGSTAQVYNTTFITNPAPQSVYQTYRSTGSNSAFAYTLTGLQVGRGYTIRLHLADPTSTGTGQAIFDVLANGGVVAQGVDIVALAGGKQKAFIQEITGVQSDVNGNLLLSFQNGSVAGSVSPGTGSPLCCGIEVVLPQGTGGVLYSLNCGGAAITPAVPAVQAGYAWSAVQQTYGVQSKDINDPLLRTLAECKTRGQYEVNKAAWARYPVKLTTASIPTVEPGHIVKWFHPRLSANGTDQWGYVQSIGRRQERTEQGGVDQDTFNTYLLYQQAR